MPDYRIATVYPGSEESVRDDPYRYLPTLGEFDLHLIAEGRHEELWRVLGAHVREVGETSGTSFAVWAPNAHGVRVTGDFNYWDGRAYPMRSLGGSGVWELFVPDVGEGARYKYAICGPDGVWREKADPMANAAETPPATASVVYTSRYTWDDDDLDDGARRAPAGARADEHLRGAPGLVAAGPVLPRAGRPARRVRRRHGVHPRGVPARRRAPVRRLVGLPGHLVLRADVPVRQP